jgi:hypothetical protein
MKLQLHKTAMIDRLVAAAQDTAIDMQTGGTEDDSPAGCNGRRDGVCRVPVLSSPPSDLVLGSVSSWVCGGTLNSNLCTDYI